MTSKKRKQRAVENELLQIVTSAVAVEDSCDDRVRLSRTVLTTMERLKVRLESLWDQAWKDGRAEGFRQAQRSRIHAGHSEFAPQTPLR